MLYTKNKIYIQDTTSIDVADYIVKVTFDGVTEDIYQGRVHRKPNGEMKVLLNDIFINYAQSVDVADLKNTATHGKIVKSRDIFKVNAYFLHDSDGGVDDYVWVCNYPDGAQPLTWGDMIIINATNLSTFASTDEKIIYTEPVSLASTVESVTLSFFVSQSASYKFELYTEDRGRRKKLGKLHEDLTEYSPYTVYHAFLGVEIDEVNKSAYLKAVYNQGVEVVAVNVDDDTEVTICYLKRFGSPANEWVSVANDWVYNACSDYMFSFTNMLGGVNCLPISNNIYQSDDLTKTIINTEEGEVCPKIESTTKYSFDVTNDLLTTIKDYPYLFVEGIYKSKAGVLVYKSNYHRNIPVLITNTNYDHKNFRNGRTIPKFKINLKKRIKDIL